MTAEIYLLYVAPLVLLAFGAGVFAVTNMVDGRDARRLQPVRVRRNHDRR
ncbi:hypothetical protein IHQ68_00495 [Chelatococcus sambhunathii]|uniref:Uncharacterized protein n=1 Tax=Chelatococcus sambhunathii TaxID=363953 RepID=A0ABU1DAM9_9HYPH|nr:hypothetical protein [Chelatococcus sambhunathii]MDR4305106.1 hypothetical protein [Chelatococcus sambhunathii]